MTVLLSRRAGMTALVAGLLATLTGTHAAAQATIPANVRLLVGYAAGGPVDAMARIFAPALARELGTTVIVENKPGASGALAGETTSTAPADGATFWFAASPTVTIVPNIQKKLKFDAMRDLTPVAPLLTYANVLVVPQASPLKSLQELLAQARANPGKVFYGSAGVGASNHLSGELLAHQAGVQLVHVPYKGNAPAMNDVIGGQLQLMFDIVGGAQKFITGGQVRALAVTSSVRNPMLPDVPTMREAGLRDFEFYSWYGLWAPAKLPAPVLKALESATERSTKSAAFKTKLNGLGFDATFRNSADFNKYIISETAKYQAIIEKAGIKIE
jgi:tripartite-type tricarboxylate transporter receptor subunit TctC